MNLRTALIICQENMQKDAERSLLGLTISERLLLSLKAGGITNVAFISNKEIILNDDCTLATISPTELRSNGEDFIAVPCDLVFDPSLLSCPEAIPGDVPIQYCKVSEWDETIPMTVELFKKQPSDAVATGHNFAIRVVDQNTATLAEQCLLRSLSKTADGIISRHLNRKISTVISRHLAPYPISPNQITAVVFLVGIISGPLACLGTYTGFVLGSFFYWFSAVLDGCDGEISRLKYQGSPLGEWLDTIVDDLVCFSFVAGMYIGLSRNVEHPYWLWCGSIAIVFYLLTLLPRYYVMVFHLESGDYQKLANEQRPTEIKNGFSKLSYAIRDVIFRTDFLPFYAMVTAIAGIVPAFAAPFAVGTIASTIDSVLSLIKYKK